MRIVCVCGGRGEGSGAAARVCVHGLLGVVGGGSLYCMLELTDLLRKHKSLAAGEAEGREKGMCGSACGVTRRVCGCAGRQAHTREGSDMWGHTRVQYEATRALTRLMRVALESCSVIPMESICVQTDVSL